MLGAVAAMGGDVSDDSAMRRRYEEASGPMMGALSGVSAAAAQRRLASRSVPNIPRTRFLPLFNCVRTDQHIDPLSSNCSTHVLRWVDGECIASIVYGK